MKDGEEFSRGFGFADITDMRQFDADTVSCGASTTKAFTATLLAILMTESKATGGRYELMQVYLEEASTSGFNVLVHTLLFTFYRIFIPVSLSISCNCFNFNIYCNSKVFILSSYL